MKKRPKALLAVAGLMMGIAVSLPVQIMLMHGHNPLEILAVLAKLAPLNWAVMMIASAFGILAFRASRGMIYAAPAFIAITGWNNWVVGQLQPGATPLGTGLISLAAAAAAALPFAIPSVRRVLANPGLRWWRTPERKRVALIAKVRPVKGGEVSAVTFDLSESGAFIATEHAIWEDRLRTKLARARDRRHCSLKVDLDPYRALHCIAKVIRHTEPRGNYPGGFALQFEGLTPDDRRMLARFLTRLQEAAAAPTAAAPQGAEPPEESAMDEETKNRLAA